MVSPNIEISWGDVDTGRLQDVLHDELADFVRNFDLRPVSEAQELRGLLIAWIATFLSETVSKDFVDNLAVTVINFRSRADFTTAGWYKTLPLDIALFSLTHDYWWLRSALTNIDHRNSALREFVLQCLALVADRVDFHDSDLLGRVENNLQVGHFYSDWCLVILAVAQGKLDAKRQLFQEWLARYEVNSLAGDVLGKLVKGDLVVNPFPAQFLRLTQYVCLQLAEHRPQAPVVGMPSQLHLSLEPSPSSLGQKLWQRLRTHPLVASHITLTGEAQP